MEKAGSKSNERDLDFGSWKLFDLFSLTLTPAISPSVTVSSHSAAEWADRRRLPRQETPQTHSVHTQTQAAQQRA